MESGKRRESYPEKREILAMSVCARHVALHIVIFYLNQAQFGAWITSSRMMKGSRFSKSDYSLAAWPSKTNMEDPLT